VLSLVVAAPTQTRAQTYSNPLVTGAADPYITYQSGSYYLLDTNLSNTVTIKASNSLATLGGAPPVNVWNAGGFFESPELYKFNNLWYIYYTQYPNSIEVLESDSGNALGTYHFKAQLTTNTYDASVLQMPGGALYLLGSTYGSIVIQPMSNPYTVSGGQTTLAVMNQPWESGVIEAPNPVWHNGQLNIIYTSGGYNASNYAVGSLRYNGGSVTSAASFSKLPGPLFTQNPSAGVYDAGVASPFSSPDGTQTYFTYSDYPYQGAPDSQRSILAQPMSFDASNNPVFGAAIGPGQQIPLPSGDPNAGSMGIPNGVYEIAAKTTGTVLDCINCSNANGTMIQLYNAWGGYCQQWAISNKGSGYYSIRNINADGSIGRSLDATGCSPNNGTQLELWDYSNGICQQWNINKQPDGFFSIGTNQPKADGTKDVLDGNGCSGAPGTHVILWSWGGGGCQQEWSFTPIVPPAIVSGAYYTLTNVAAGLNLDDPNGTNVAGTKVQLFPANGATAQNWKLTKQANGSYTLTNQAGGLNLDDPNALGQGTLQQIWPANGATAQQWNLTPTSNGAYTLTNVATGLCLDDPSGSITAGTQLQLWPSNGATPQQWRLTPQ